MFLKSVQKKMEVKARNFLGVCDTNDSCTQNTLIAVVRLFLVKAVEL